MSPPRRCIQLSPSLAGGCIGDFRICQTPSVSRRSSALAASPDPCGSFSHLHKREQNSKRATANTNYSPPHSKPTARVSRYKLPPPRPHTHTRHTPCPPDFRDYAAKDEPLLDFCAPDRGDVRAPNEGVAYGRGPRSGPSGLATAALCRGKAWGSIDPSSASRVRRSR